MSVIVAADGQGGTASEDVLGEGAGGLVCVVRLPGLTSETHFPQEPTTGTLDMKARGWVGADRD
jgi:hypothetical protein